MAAALVRAEVGRGAAVLWSDVHRTGRLCSLWFILLIALTGIWYFVEAAGVDMGYPAAPRAASAPVKTPLSADSLLGFTLPGRALGRPVRGGRTGRRMAGAGSCQQNVRRPRQRSRGVPAVRH